VLRSHSTWSKKRGGGQQKLCGGEKRGVVFERGVGVAGGSTPSKKPRREGKKSQKKSALPHAITQRKKNYVREGGSVAKESFLIGGGEV